LPLAKSRQGAKAPEPAPTTGSTDDPQPRATLRVYNYAYVDPAILRVAKQVVTAIFDGAGVETVWVDCPPSIAESDRYPACRQKERTRDFQLRVMTASMAAKLPTPHNPLGFAQPCPDDGRGCVANIFYARVDELASKITDQVALHDKDGRAARILGHAMAHEVGPLLLGPNAHTPDGIMRGKWSADDLKFMSWTYLFFSPPSPSSCELISAGAPCWRSH